LKGIDMRFRTINIIVIILLSLSSLSAQTHIAVVDFESLSVSSDDSKALTNRLMIELHRTNMFKVLEREMLDKIIEEQKFQLSGCNSNQCLVELGQLANVHQIVTGSISKVGHIYTITARLISVETGEVVTSGIFDDEGNIGTLMKEGMASIAAQLASIQVQKNQENTRSKKLENQNPVIISTTPIEVLFEHKTNIEGLLISPDGRTIVFKSRKYIEWRRAAIHYIYQYDIRTGKKTLLVTDKKFRLDVIAWHPKENYFVFDRNGTPYKYEVLTYKESLFYELNSDYDSPVFSPSGDHVVFIHGEKNQRALRIFNLQSDEIKFGDGIQLSILASSPAWSPNGGNIAFSSHTPGAINFFDINTMKTETMVNEFEFPGDLWWSPNGSYIAFSSFKPSSINLLDTSTMKTEVIMRGFDFVSDLCWSPNGKYFAFSGREQGREQTWQGRDQIWIVRLSDRKIRNINEVTTNNKSCYHPIWSKDTKEFMFVTDERQELVKVHFDETIFDNERK
jgi:Tol biopolymer transport system component/TolB-like protein